MQDRHSCNTPPRSRIPCACRPHRHCRGIAHWPPKIARQQMMPTASPANFLQRSSPVRSGGKRTDEIHARSGFRCMTQMHDNWGIAQPSSIVGSHSGGDSSGGGEPTCLLGDLFPPGERTSLACWRRTTSWATLRASLCLASISSFLLLSSASRSEAVRPPEPEVCIQKTSPLPTHRPIFDWREMATH